eukprot:207476_1
MPTNFTGEAQLETTTAFTYFIFAIVILIHHTVSLHKTIGKKAFDWRYLKAHPSLLFAYALFVSGFFLGANMVMGTIVGFTSSADDLCPVQVNLGGPLYMIFKLFLYLVLVSRTWQTFNFASQSLHYKAKPLIIYSCIMVLWTIGNIIGNVSTITYTTSESYPRCTAHVHRSVLISMSSLDFISGIINMILFIKPFIQLSKMRDIKVSIRNVAVKQTILAIIALVSTLMALIMMATIGLPKILAAFDAVVSTLCIALMHKWHFGCVSSMLFCCMLPETEKYMAKHKDDHSKTSVPSSKTTVATETETETAPKPKGDDRVTIPVTNE